MEDKEMRKITKKKQMRAGAYILSAALAMGALSGCAGTNEKDTLNKESQTVEKTQETTIVKDQEETMTKDVEETKPDVEVTASTEDVDFAFTFLKMEDKGNVIYSPLSIRYALNMLKEGANGNTKSQIENLIGTDAPGKYDNIENVLSLANAVYIRDSFSEYVKDGYINTLSDKYNAEVIYDAFENANNINGWIENKTFDQIKNMLDDKDVSDPGNVMMLVNALAMDMEWEYQFDERDTNSGKFYLEDGTQMDAAVMSKHAARSDGTAYYTDDSVTALSLDLKKYGDNQLQFLAIMPEEKLSEYTQNFNAETLNNITDNLTKASDTKDGVNVAIPRFSFDYKLKLEEDLNKLGITDAFDKELADFTGVTDKKPFYVDKALHKAKIDFSEKGIKAAAATVIMMAYETAIVEEKPVDITIDKPFMYVIRDKKTGEIWFAGTVYEPDLWENVKGDYIYE